jgi:hypothetical protein
MASIISVIAAGAASAGSAVAGAGGLMTALSVGTTIVGGVASMQQAEAQAEQAELAAQREEINSRMQAIEVGEDLLETLSSNNAAAAASGLQGSGSVQRAQEASQRSAERELDINRMNRDQSASASKANAKSLRRGGMAALGGSLLDAGTTGYSAYTKVKKVK